MNQHHVVARMGQQCILFWKDYLNFQILHHILRKVYIYYYYYYHYYYYHYCHYYYYRSHYY
jgi:hypothetical protein